VNVPSPIVHFGNLNPFSGSTKAIIILLLLLFSFGGQVRGEDDDTLQAVLQFMKESKADNAAREIENAEREAVLIARIDELERDKSDDDDYKGRPKNASIQDDCEALERALRVVDRCLENHTCKFGIFETVIALRERCTTKKRPRRCDSWDDLDIHLKSCLAANAECDILMNDWLEMAEACDGVSKSNASPPDCAKQQRAFQNCTEHHPTTSDLADKVIAKNQEACQTTARKYKACREPDSRESRSAIAMAECESQSDELDRFDCIQDALDVGEGSLLERSSDRIDRFKSRASSAYEDAKDFVGDVKEWGRDRVVQGTEHVRRFIQPRVRRRGNDDQSGRYYQ
jgi:hypothetical protein